MAISRIVRLTYDVLHGPRLFNRIWKRRFAKRNIQSGFVFQHEALKELCPLQIKLQREKQNVILMGCPGSGKTTIGSLVGKMLGMWQLDVDNDHLEPLWGTSVADKLQELGDERFLEEEGKALSRLNVSNRIISLTGSNPLHRTSMTRLRATGVVVYLDVPISDILSRLGAMKTDRIVGQENGCSIENILQYRLLYYEDFYDIRVIVGKNETCESIAQRVIEQLRMFYQTNHYVSTRDATSDREETDKKRTSFADATIQGFAQDGGLFVPAQNIPRFTQGELERMVPLSYPDRALRVMQKWVSPKEIDSQALRSFLLKAYSSGNFGDANVFPVRHLQGDQYVVELFHGPTASFKDSALQIMPHLFQHATENSTHHGQRRYLILVATSGDTGGAVLDGFSRISEDANVGIMVLYPENGISEMQKAQMVAMNGRRTQAIGVTGDFDHCQSAIKRIFRDVDLCEELKQEYSCQLSAANSINWARLLPQVIHHCSAYLDLIRQAPVNIREGVDYCIPTGNFGNILSAYYAKHMGIPFRQLICASNVNNVLVEFINTGRYDLSSRRLQQTGSPAIDILKSSNLERYLWHILGGRGETISQLYASLESRGFFEVTERAREIIQRDFLAGWCSEDECLANIKQTFKDHNYLLDPHTSVAKVVADRFQETSRPMLIAATAHYAKFPDAVFHALNMDMAEKDLIPAEMLKHLEDLHATPGMHQNLAKAIQSQTQPEPICSASFEDIVKRIKIFVHSMYK